MYIEMICIALLRGCVIRYPPKNSKYVRRLKRLKLLAHRHNSLGPGIKSRICIGILYKAVYKSPAPQKSGLDVLLSQCSHY